MTTAYSYVRFSSKGQTSGDSLRRQIDESRKYAAKQGWELDESLRGLAVSAFKGKHRQAGSSLARFITLIQEGQVQPGNWLIIEALDRLSREQVSHALPLFLSILNGGVGIVTLMDTRQYTQKSIDENPFELMYSIALMAAANEYSRKLSERVREAKEQAIKDLLSGRRAVIHGKPPFWIRWDRDAGRYTLHPERAKIMREAVALALDGIGTSGIAKRFTAKGYKTHSGKSRWEDTSLYYQLRSRALFGEYTPKRIDSGKRHERCDPIPDYYPALLTREQFYELQAVLDARKQNIKGRRGSGIMFNLFGRLLRCGHDGTLMHVITRRNKKGGRKLYTSLANEDFSVSFPYEPLVTAFIQFVTEVRLKPKTKNQTDDVAVWRGQMVERKARLAALRAALKGGDVSKLNVVIETIAQVQTEIDDLHSRIERKLAEQQKVAASPADISDLSRTLRAAKGDDAVELKQRLRIAIADVVREAHIWVHGNTVKRVAVLLVVLRDGEERTLAVRCCRGQEPWAITDDRKGTPFDLLPDYLILMRDQPDLWAKGGKEKPGFEGLAGKLLNARSADDAISSWTGELRLSKGAKMKVVALQES